MALYSALLDILFYDRRDLTVDLLKQWGFSSWKYADYTRTGITNFMTRFEDNETIVGELSQYDIDDIVYFAKPHGRGYLYYLENMDEAHAIEFRDKLLDIMKEHPTTSLQTTYVEINGSIPPMTPHMNKALGTSRAQGFVFTIVQLTSDQ